MVSRPKRMMRNLTAAILLICSGLVGAEFWLRSVRGVPARLVAARAELSLQSMLMPSETCHHVLTPGYSGSIPSHTGSSEQINVTISPHGFRETPAASERDESSSLKVLLLGDDTIFGTGVDQKHTVAAFLQVILTKELGQSVEVINGGVPGYAPLLSWIHFREHCLELNPDIVVLHVDMTDVSDDQYYRRLTSQRKGRSVCVHDSLRTAEEGQTPLSPPFWSASIRQSALAQFLIEAARTTAERRSANVATMDSRDSQLAWVSDDPPDLRLQVRHMLEPIEQLQRITNQAGCRFLVSTAPIHWQVFSATEYPELSEEMGISGVTPYSTQLPSEVLKQFCTDRGIGFLDTRPAFSQSKAGEKLFSPYHLTLSELGMALYARELASFILSKAAENSGS